MKKFDWLYGQNWIAQMQYAYANGILCSSTTPRSIERCLFERHDRMCDTIMHIHWWSFDVTMDNVWHRRYAESNPDDCINILMR